MILLQKYVFLLLDAAFFSVAAVLAWFLRVGLDTGLANFEAFSPYALISLSVAVVVFQLFHMHRHFFRFFSIYDLVQLGAATTISVLMTVLIAFIVFRLDAVQRSIPFLHWSFAMVGFSLIRMAGLIIGARRETMVADGDTAVRSAVLLIGYTSTADLFMRGMPIFSNQEYFVCGILDENPRYLGKRLRQCEVIGHPLELDRVLAKMTLHGVVVRRIILCIDKSLLSPKTQKMFDRWERDRGIELHDYVHHEHTFFHQNPDPVVATANIKDRFEVPDEVRARAELSVARYGPLKRVLDILVSLIVGALLLPLILLILPVIRFSMGSQVVFWQERLGHGGKMFRLFKLRTLSHGVDSKGRVLDGAARQTTVGRFLRRTRLDETPQLLNILAGDMSLIGPRPLLPVDLPDDLPGWSELRTLVRPGITGWAQVNGGQQVNKQDKVLMDAHYVANMSLKLDLYIVLLTLKMMIRGEKLDRDAIRKTYDVLGVLPVRPAGAQENSVMARAPIEADKD